MHRLLVSSMPGNSPSRMYALGSSRTSNFGVIVGGVRVGRAEGEDGEVRVRSRSRGTWAVLWVCAWVVRFSLLKVVRKKGIFVVVVVVVCRCFGELWWEGGL